MSWLRRVLFDNPVLIKELRVRMRGTRAYWILFGYLGFLSFVLLSAYGVWQSKVEASGVGGSEASRIGGELFISVIICQMFLVLFITPAITSGSVTLEKEQRTLDILILTRMSRSSIIFGKLLSAVSFTALLLISSLPLISICFMLGSVDPAMVISTYMMLLFGSLLIGAMGLMWSSIAKTTSMAVLFTYGTLFVLFVLGWVSFASNTGGFGSGNGSIGENVLRSIGAPLFGSSYLGVNGPDGIGFSVVCVLASILMSAIAMVRLEMFPERRASLLRGLTILLASVLLLGSNVWWLQVWYRRSAQAIQVVAQPPIIALIVTALVLMLIVPTFATGELRPYEARRFGKHLAWGWSLRGLSRGNMASGLPFLLILTMVSLCIYACPFVLFGKAGDIMRSASLGSANVAVQAPVATNQLPQINGNKPKTPPPPPPQPGSRTVPPLNYRQTVGDFPQAAFMLIAFVIGFSLFCMFLSIAFRNRWVAWALAYVLLLAIWIAPEWDRAPADNGLSPGFFVNLYYLNPAQALCQMGDSVNYWIHNSILPMGPAPMWARVSEAWLAIGVLSLLLSMPFIARERKMNAEIPYEEMVAEA